MKKRRQNKTMNTTATSRYPATGVNESMGSQLSDEDLEKLQEIHELINLIYRELPVAARGAGAAYAPPMLQAAPYAQPFLQFQWDAQQFMTPHGF